MNAYQEKLEINQTPAKTQNMDIENTIPQGVNFDLQSPQPSSLEIENIQYLNLPETNTQIKKIYKELKKEKQVKKVQKKIITTTNASKKKIKKQVFNYEKSLNLLKKNFEKINFSSSHLSQQQRKSLYDHLKEFAILLFRKEDILMSLEKIKNPGQAATKSETSKKYFYLEVLESLDKIGWSTSPEISKFSPTAVNTSSKDSIDFGWGDWHVQNPYRHFFSTEQEWKKLFQQIIKDEDNLKKSLNNPWKKIISKSNSSDHISSKKFSFAKFPIIVDALRNSKNNIEIIIGKKLLEIMRQEQLTPLPNV